MLSKMSKKIRKICLTLFYLSFFLFIIFFIVMIISPNGIYINSKTIDNIYYYKEQAQVINKKMNNKIYNSKEEIVLEIKGIADKDFYNENIYFLQYNFEELKEFNNVTLKNEIKGLKFKELYIPTDIDFFKISKYKNKLFENNTDFEIMLNSLNIEEDFKEIIKKNAQTKNDVIEKITKYYGILMIVVIILASIGIIFLYIEEKEKIKEKKEIRQEEKDNPNKIKPVLDYAKIELQEQMTNIRSQSRVVFIASIFFIIIGLIIIIYMFLFKDNSIKVSIITAFGGIIAEIIGGGLLVMYRYLMVQLNENLKILERLNIIGVSTKILDTLEIENMEEINKAKIELAKKIIDKLHY